MNKNTFMIVSVALIIIALGGGFFAGMQYQKSQNPFAVGGNRMFIGGNGQGNNGRFMGANGQRFSPVRGQVIDLSSNSFTVKLQDGTSKIVVMGSNTIFAKSQTATLSDLKTGDSVMVIGTNNSDGSVTASDVSINPQQFRTEPRPTSAN